MSVAFDVTCLACFLFTLHFCASAHADAVTSSVNDADDS